MAEVLYWISTFVLILTLLVLLGYQLILLVDLEFDYINPYDSTSRVNYVILPEFLIMAIFCFLNLIAGHWFIFLIALPCLYYNVSIIMRPSNTSETYFDIEYQSPYLTRKLISGTSKDSTTPM
ncbi:cornichon family protein [Medicago truncatula]|uniref:Cornichon family protein n=1 Tax=Medicago truncatula TaxID=3880 RepID=A0A072U0U8_MEDTR|nr:cornichon family protein [Medicago truncatula]